MKLTRRWFLPVIAVSVLVAAACGGSSGSTGTRGAVSNAPSLHASDSVQFVNLAQSAETLTELTSFRFDLTLQMKFSGLDSGSSDDPLAQAFASALLDGLSDVSVDGTVAGPEEYAVNANAFGQSFGYVRIGDQAWQNVGSGWETTTPDEPALPLDFSSGDLSDILPDEALQAAVVGTEVVNGAETTHYAFDKDALVELAQTLGGEISPTNAAALDSISKINLDVWLAAGDVPVRIVFAMSGSDESGASADISLELNIHDINSPSLSVKPPL
jgi:hypothetical protein